MAVIRLKKTEHYKIADFTFIELEAEITEKVEDKKKGLENLHKILRSYHNAARKELKEAFDRGDFDLTELDEE